jgi:PIN domain nuclease of toxin-antitoxin system
MRLLLDAQPLIWHSSGDTRLPERVRTALRDGNHELFISEATFWEIAIKFSLKKLEVLGGVESLRSEWIESGGAQAVPVEWRHSRRVFDLPFLHRDPFDRFLVSQALTERLTLVTGDPHLAAYPGVKVLW